MIILSTALPEPAYFRVGCAEAVITPPVGISLAGYFHDRIAESIRDDLKVHALVIESQDKHVALVSCDLITMTADVTSRARSFIANEVGIPPESVFICATHTHTGPEIRSNGVVPQAVEWTAQLPRRIADTVKVAANSMFEATLRPSRTNVEGYSFNRLFRLKDGSEIFGKRGREGEIISTAGPIDPELQTLAAVDLNGDLRALVVNFALHPDVIGGATANFISADWPGILGEQIKAVYGQGTVVLFLQGTAGDINHVPHEPTHLPTRGPAKALQLARGLAGATMYATEKAEPMSDATLKATLEIIQIPYYTRDAGLLAEVEALERKESRTPFEEYLVQRTKTWAFDGKTADVPIHALRIGSVGIVGLPAEIFVKLGLEIKHYSPAPYTFVVELANDRVSNYVPTTDQAERGAYGAKPILSRWLCADAGRRMVDKAITMLHNLWD